MRPAVILIRNHFYGMRHALRHVREQPLLKVLVIGGFSVAWLIGLSVLFYEGFKFMYLLGGVAFYLIPRLFTLFFMGLGAMLVLSVGVTGYGNLFQSAESRRLLTWPIGFLDLFYYQLVKTTLMSSWAFFFIILPFLGAYGWFREWHWTMILWSFAFSLPFVMVFSGIGVLLMLALQGVLNLLSRLLGRHRNLFLWLAALLLLVRGVYWAFDYLAEMRGRRDEDMLVMVRMIPGLGVASNPMLPNWWITQGLLNISNGAWSRGLVFLTLLVSNVGVLFLAVARLGVWLYPAGMQRHLTAANDTAESASRLSRVVSRLAPGRHSFRGYVTKDILLFLRDPSQWTQFLIFFGLLALYFFNLGSLGYDQLDPIWSNLIAFLNMFSLAAVMSSLSSRFVYPQLSQEGRMLWMVGLAPHSLTKLMFIKFFIAGVSLLLVSFSLSYISNTMLNIPEFGRRLTLVLMPGVSFALAGMATGLGAVFMDIEAKTPTQILSGYGGTLNLILTLFTVIVLVLVPGIVAHLMTTNNLPAAWEPRAFPLTAAYILLLSLLAGGLPLWAGKRALETRDF